MRAQKLRAQPISFPLACRLRFFSRIEFSVGTVEEKLTLRAARDRDTPIRLVRQVLPQRLQFGNGEPEELSCPRKNIASVVLDRHPGHLAHGPR